MVKVGVDAGGTLIKIAYRENSQWRFTTFPTRHIQEAAIWLQNEWNDLHICLTGGKAGAMKRLLNTAVSECLEFTATCRGAVHLARQQALPVGDRFILANVGTGTSVHLIEGDRYRRVAGSGIGGGTFVGLSYLLTGEGDFQRLVTFSEKGRRDRLDLQVKDIYTGIDSPILGSLTASNFGKAGNESTIKEDAVAAVAGMVAETVTIISTQEAEHYEADVIVYIGSTFHHHPVLAEAVSTYTKMKEKMPCFLENGEMSGAIGALLLKD
ncbi:MAG TPA: type II pantothenate kinase [Bacillales bacterium]|nr:type II pantothenate kinase [Bacillales bacterium]